MRIAQLYIFHLLYNFLLKVFGISDGRVVDNILNGHFLSVLSTFAYFGVSKSKAMVKWRGIVTNPILTHPQYQSITYFFWKWLSNHP